MVAGAGCDGRCCLPLFPFLEIKRNYLIPGPSAAHRRKQQPYGLQDILDPSLHRTSSPNPNPLPEGFATLIDFFFILLHTPALQAALWLHLLLHTSCRNPGFTDDLACKNVHKDLWRRSMEVWLKC